MTSSTSTAISDLEALLDEVIEQQKEASTRHDRALRGLKEALDHLAEVYDLSVPEDEK